jgi:ABC-2 type transport system permease protein
MARGLELVSDVLPMTYAFDALSRLSVGDEEAGRLLLDAAVLAVVTLGALGLGAATLRRRTA